MASRGGQRSNTERITQRSHSCSLTAPSGVEDQEQRVLRSIVDQARQGDEEAFAALVRAVGDRCIFIADRILRDANLAEDRCR
jgi:hypothetical protein